MGKAWRPKRGVSVGRRWWRSAVVVLAAVVGWAVAAAVVEQQAARDAGRQVGTVTAVTIDGESGAVAVTIATGRGEAIAIRLVGVACPPAWADRTRAWLAELIEGQAVTVSLLERRNPTRRGFVYRRRDRLLVNEHMIDRGYATTDGSSHAVDGWFAKLEGWARGRGRGLWAGSADDQM